MAYRIAFWLFAIPLICAAWLALAVFGFNALVTASLLGLI